jgi:hypothetical protein
MLREDLAEGLSCILTAVEHCQVFEIMRDRAAKQLLIEPRHRSACSSITIRW